LSRIKYVSRKKPGGFCPPPAEPLDAARTA
jgi:hypothetical protein